MHFELGRHLRLFDGLASFRLALQRQIRGEWFFGNDDGSGMNTGRAFQTFESFGDINDLPHIFFGFIDFAKFLSGLITLFVLGI